MKKVTGIGFRIPGEDENYIRLDSLSSLSETDIAIFSPNFLDTYYYQEDKTYEGRPLYDAKSSVNILDHSEHWKKELLHFLEIGGTLVIILCKKDNFYVHSGKKEISGTGINRSTTNFVQPFSNYKFLPFSEFDFKPSFGKTIVSNSAIIKELYNNLGQHFSHEVFIENYDISKSIFTTKNRDKTLGINFKHQKGNVLLIPSLNLDYDKFTVTKKGKEYWSEEGMRIASTFIKCLVEIDKAIRKGEERTPKPAWVNSTEYILEESQKISRHIEQNNKEIIKLQDENSTLSKELEEQDVIKDLLFEAGTPLENSVTKALKILGYTAENYNDGDLELDQVIISPEGHRFIGECEGKDNKDIDISKFRQLHESLSADFDREEIHEKAFGLLIGNPQRLMNPSERTLSFTKKCQVGAKREKIGLIKTEDLFRVCRYILESNDSDYAYKCRKAIFEQLGEIVQFPSFE